MGPEVRHNRASLPGGWAAEAPQATAQARGRLLLKTSPEIKSLSTALSSVTGRDLCVCTPGLPLDFRSEAQMEPMGNQSCISTALNKVG